MINLKKIILLLIFSTSIGFAQITNIGEAINKAGRQRMLSQRMAKDYMMIGSGNKVEDATKELDDSSTLFNETHNELMLYCKTDGALEALGLVNALWKKYRQKILSTPDIDNAATIINDANNLTNACNLVVDKIVAESNSKKAILPNICGRQRMLSQRMALIYTAYAWQVGSKTLAKDLQNTMDEFQKGLTTLIESPENTDEINTILRLQTSEWDFLKSSFDLNNSRLSPTQIFSSTNLVLKNFDMATKLYAKLI